MERDEVIAQLNQVQYLFLCHISEPRDNSLRLVVEEAIADRSESQPAPNPSDPFVVILANSVPIRPVGGCKIFEVEWRRYAAYLVTEELVRNCASHEDEIYVGKVFRSYSQSNFLRHLSVDTDGHIEPILHYKILCENHVVDVASYAEPEMRILGKVPEGDASRARPN